MKHTLYIVFIIIILAFSGCKKDDVQVQEFKITSESVYKNTSTIIITVNYTYASVIQSVEGYISESSDMTNAVKVNGDIQKYKIVLMFDDLKANTTYYYYYILSNGIDNITTEGKVITTNDYGLPTVITNDVTDITATSAICGGKVTDDGESEITARGICYSLDENPTINDSHTIDSIGIGSFTSHLVDLNCDTTYYYRAYATNIKGTSYGEQIEFNTLDGLPNVMTRSASNITSTSVVSGGIITDDGGFEITARGICWSTNPYPTINDNYTTDSIGTGSYYSTLNNLTCLTTYYIRAYATNIKGTKYGTQISFKTKYDAPYGAIAGIFSVSATKQVCFSKGNLQYQASTNTWRFAVNQWDYIGNNNTNIGPNYSGLIDLFGWGTSGYNHGAIYYQPWSTSQTNSDYYAYGSDSYNLNDQTGKADWGYNAILNGENTENIWRTLSKDEWVYIFNTRRTNSGMRYAKAIVNGINGVILLPDEWNSSYYSLNNTNTSEASYNSNTISKNDWETNLEANGAVFLPAAGSRDGMDVDFIGSYGIYWSTTYYNNFSAFRMAFTDWSLDDSDYYFRKTGSSVRLVCDAE